MTRTDGVSARALAASFLKIKINFDWRTLEYGTFSHIRASCAPLATSMPLLHMMRTQMHTDTDADDVTLLNCFMSHAAMPCHHWQCFFSRKKVGYFPICDLKKSGKCPVFCFVPLFSGNPYTLFPINKYNVHYCLQISTNRIWKKNGKCPSFCSVPFFPGNIPIFENEKTLHCESAAHPNVAKITHGTFKVQQTAFEVSEIIVLLWMALLRLYSKKKTISSSDSGADDARLRL